MSTVYIVISGGEIPSETQIAEIIELLPDPEQMEKIWIAGYEGDLSKNLGFDSFTRVTNNGTLRISMIEQAHSTLDGKDAMIIATYGNWDDSNHLGVWKSEYTNPEDEANVNPIRIFESTAGPSKARRRLLLQFGIQRRRLFPPIDVKDLGPGI